MLEIANRPAPAKFDHARASAVAAAHKTEGERLRASVAARREFARTRPLGADDLRSLDARVARDGELAAIHERMHADATAEIGRKSTFFQRHRKGAERTMIVLAVTSEVVTIPFFVCSIVQMARKKPIPTVRVLPVESGAGGTYAAPGVSLAA